MMMVGDIDFEALITDSLQERNQLTGAPHVPIPGFTASILLIFCFFMPVLLMNLLVSVKKHRVTNPIETDRQTDFSSQPPHDYHPSLCTGL